MKSYLIITAVGPDRPGLVEQVSAALAARNLNIESSRMAVLGGEFALIMLVSGEEAEVLEISSRPKEVAGETGLTIFLKPTVPPQARPVPASLPYVLVASGMDHPGIVHEISRTLHEFQVNIESLDTRVTPAPISGAPIFTMEAVVAVPAGVRIKSLKDRLAELAESLNMDIEFEPEEAR